MSIAIGIIGGIVLYDMAELTDREERHVDTPFGSPSAPYVIGTLKGKRLTAQVFLPTDGTASGTADRCGSWRLGSSRSSSSAF